MPRRRAARGAQRARRHVRRGAGDVAVDDRDRVVPRGHEDDPLEHGVAGAPAPRGPRLGREALEPGVTVRRLGARRVRLEPERPAGAGDALLERQQRHERPRARAGDEQAARGIRRRAGHRAARAPAEPVRQPPLRRRGRAGPAHG